MVVYTNKRPYLYSMEIKNKNSENFIVNQVVMAGIKVGSAIKYMPAQIKKIDSTTCTVHVLCVGSYIVNKKYIY
jgi:hypothetical protein